MDAAEPQQLPEIILSTLGFNASLVALLLDVQGYIAVRLTPANAPLLHRRILWIVPGLLLALYAVFEIARDYRKLMQACV